MVEAVREGRITVDQLRSTKQEALDQFYPDAKRTLLVSAREDALKLLAATVTHDKAPT